MKNNYNKYIFSNHSSNFNVLEKNILLNNNEAIKRVGITIDLSNKKNKSLKLIYFFCLL